MSDKGFMLNIFISDCHVMKVVASDYKPCSHTSNSSLPFTPPCSFWSLTV